MCESSCLKADRKKVPWTSQPGEKIGYWALVGRGGSSEQRQPALPFLKFAFVFSKNHMFLEGAFRGREDSSIVCEFLILSYDRALRKKLDGT